MKVSENDRLRFQEAVWQYYAGHAREALPWRVPEPDGSFDPYKILVSELMLQQTQVARVISKYHEFLSKFPDIRTLAAAPLGDVLRVWQGLGYNRRAKFLWLAAQHVAAHGWPEDLTVLPGVGANTAGAIQAYAYDRAVIFVETNIRTVYIYHFTRDGENVPDSFIRDLVAQTLDYEHPREWYWALMDYGSYLKTQVRNNAQSTHYRKQPAFHGSRRQVRGAVLRELSSRPQNLAELRLRVADDRLDEVLSALEAEGLITKSTGVFRLA